MSENDFWSSIVIAIFCFLIAILGLSVLQTRGFHPVGFILAFLLLGFSIWNFFDAGYVVSKLEEGDQ